MAEVPQPEEVTQEGDTQQPTVPDMSDWTPEQIERYNKLQLHQEMAVAASDLPGPPGERYTVEKHDASNKPLSPSRYGKYPELIRSITQQFHDEIAKELENRQQDLNDRLKHLTSDNKSFQLNASYLLDLAQRAGQLFKDSDERLRQMLLEYLLSNIELKDKKLSYVLNSPFSTDC